MKISMKSSCWLGIFLFSVVTASPAVSSHFKSSVGVGIQYGGLPGWKGSYHFGNNSIRMSYGYAGFAWGYDRFIGHQTAVGIQSFGNQFNIGYALNLNYYFNGTSDAGWVLGLDVYRGYDSDDFAVDFLTDIFLNPTDIDFDAELETGVLFSLGYQF